MRAGELRHYVEVKSPVDTKSADHQLQRSYTRIGYTYAAIEGISGREYMQGDREVMAATNRIVMRYMAGVTPGCIVVYGSRTFELNHVNNMHGRDEMLECMATEVVL